MGRDHNLSNLMTNLTVGLALGALAGVAIGLMLAPKSGSHTRSLVKEAIARGVDRLLELPTGQELQVK